MTSSGIHVVWFKRDLRTVDHAPLVHAAAAGCVLPVYLAEPDYWRGEDTSARKWRFIAHSLAVLNHALHAMGGALWLPVGQAVTVFEALLEAVPIAAVWSHAETGNEFTFQRDRAVAALLKARGVPWYEFRQDAVRRGRVDRLDYAAHWAQFVSQPIVPAPTEMSFFHALPHQLAASEIPSEQALGLAPDYCPAAQPGGRLRGLNLLASFLAKRGERYATAMSSPRTAPQHCSRLSPHLAYGTISLREVVQATRAKQQAIAPEKLPYWPRSLQAFTARLAWQSHFMQKLETEPEMEWRHLHPALRYERQAVDARLMQAFATGTTGLPMIDACMARLQATGWINFRMRALLAAITSGNLGRRWARF